jgi:hypothetical protein
MTGVTVDCEWNHKLTSSEPRKLGKLPTGEGRYQTTSLAALHGELMEDVKFGGGRLGHVNKGGTFEVRQAEGVRGHWRVAHSSRLLA